MPRRFQLRDPVIPRHVRACSASGSRLWWIYTWKWAAELLKQRRPYLCGSWRCHGCHAHHSKKGCAERPHECRSCARYEASVTFARIREACEPLRSEGFVFFVLTLDRDGFFSGKPWPDATTAYRAIGSMAQSFLYKLRRWMRRQGMTAPKNEWIATVEAHRTGWPHYNLMLYAPELADFLDDSRPKRPNDHATSCRCRDCRESVLLRDELLELATRSGWGVQSTAERVRSGKEAVASYIVKLAGFADVAAAAFTGEVAKITQAPMNAPERFRRLRAGKGFLPPRRKDPDVTGTLVRRQHETDGTVTVLPLHKVNADLAPHVAACCLQEEEIAHRELAAKARAKSLGVYGFLSPNPIPLVSTWTPKVHPQERPAPIRIDPEETSRTLSDQEQLQFPETTGPPLARAGPRRQTRSRSHPQ